MSALDLRLRRALGSGAAAIVSKGVLYSSLFVAIRLAGHVATGERYGAWLTLVTMSSLLLMLDLGLGYSLLNAVSGEPRDSQSDVLQKTVSSAFFFLGGLSALLAAALLVAWRTTNLAELFKVGSGPHVTEISDAILCFGLVFLAYLPLSLIRHIYNGKQIGYRYSFIEAGAAAIAFVLFLAAVTFAPTLPWMTASLVSGPLIAGAVAGVLAFKRSFPGLRPRIAQIRMQVGANLFKYGIAFVVLQISAGIVYYLDGIIISRLFGLRAVPTYIIPQQLYSLFQMGLGFLLLPFWPAYRESIASGAADWTRRMFRTTMALTLVASVTGAIALYFLCDRIIAIWTGHAVATPDLLKLGLSSALVLYSCGSAYALLLNALSAIYIQAVIALVCALASVFARIYLADVIGLSGIIWGNVAAYSLCVIVPHIFLYHKLTGPLRAMTGYDARVTVTSGSV